jgi:hypothetical protein
MSRFQYFKNFNFIEYATYDPYRFNTKQTKIVPFVSQLSCGIPKSFFIFNKLKKSSSADSFHFFKNFFLHFSYHLNFKNLTNFKTLFVVLEAQIIPFPAFQNVPTLSFDFTSIFYQVNSLELFLIKEYYKILSLL